MVFVFFLASRTDYGICDVDVLKVAVAARTQLPCPPAEDEVVVVFVCYCFWFVGFWLLFLVLSCTWELWNGRACLEMKI